MFGSADSFRKRNGFVTANVCSPQRQELKLLYCHLPLLARELALDPSNILRHVLTVPIETFPSVMARGLGLTAKCHICTRIVLGMVGPKLYLNSTLESYSNY